MPRVDAGIGELGLQDDAIEAQGRLGDPRGAQAEGDGGRREVDRTGGRGRGEGVVDQERHRGAEHRAGRKAAEHRARRADEQPPADGRQRRDEMGVGPEARRGGDRPPQLPEGGALRAGVVAVCRVGLRRADEEVVADQGDGRAEGVARGARRVDQREQGRASLVVVGRHRAAQRRARAADGVVDADLLGVGPGRADRRVEAGRVRGRVRRPGGPGGGRRVHRGDVGDGDADRRGRGPAEAVVDGQPGGVEPRVGVHVLRPWAGAGGAVAEVEGVGEGVVVGLGAAAGVEGDGRALDAAEVGAGVRLGGEVDDGQEVGGELRGLADEVVAVVDRGCRGRDRK